MPLERGRPVVSEGVHGDGPLKNRLRRLFWREGWEGGVHLTVDIVNRNMREGHRLMVLAILFEGLVDILSVISKDLT